jgi:thioredoxin reductase
MMQPEHHTVAIVGGGPAGLPLAVVLAGGWWPFYRSTPAFRTRHPDLDPWLRTHQETLLALDFRALAAGGMRPVDFFNSLHRPAERFLGLEQIALEFRRHDPVDCLLLSREPVGGLWNNVPHNLLTLSPAHWMEMAFYPIALWAAEHGRGLDPDALIVKQDLLAYYHSIPERFGVASAIRTGLDVTRIEPLPGPSGDRFLLIATGPHGEEQRYSCDYLVYAAGQRCTLRRLGIPGEDLPLVSRHYDRPESFPGGRILVVGGGRSADWAATELHDDGRHVTYIMRQPGWNHWRLISDSRAGLPYYERIAQIIESGSPRFDTRYETHLEEIQPDGSVTLRQGERREHLPVDRILLEIGGEVDYRPFHGFPELTRVEKRDRYRFQCWQLATHPHNYESIDLPRLYAGGYLAAGINNVVVAMHGTTYAIAGDILQRSTGPGGSKVFRRGSHP